MVDPLNNTSPQSKSQDTGPTKHRLGAYLAQGQARTAQVVQVTPQRQPGPASTPAQGVATPSATTSAAATTPPTHPVTTVTGTAAQPPSSTERFKILVRLEGRLFELLTNMPLPPDSRVQISRDSSGRISLQLAPQAQPAATGQHLPPATGQTGAAVLANGVRGRSLPAQELPPQPAGRQAAAAATAPTTAAAARTASSDNPTTASATTRAPSGPSSTASAPPPSATSAAVAATSANPAAAVRIELQPLKVALPIRPGERLTAEVISSRPTATATPPPSTSSGSAMPAVTPTPTATPSPQAPATNPGADSHMIRINLQGQKIELVSPRPLPPGSQLQLVHDSKGHLWAELPSAKTQAIEQALREHLPQQQSPAPLLNLLASAQASGQLQQAKPLLLNLINLLTGRSLSSPQQADADSVKQQVQNSGSLLENKLARGDTQNLNQDHKALLLRLAQQLGQSSSQAELPKTLSEQITQLTQQALSRVLVNQITSSLGGQPQDTGTETNRTLALDIPVSWQGNTENLQLKVQRDANGTDEKSGEMLYRWRIRLNFEIAGSRQLEAELTLEHERVSVIWSGDRRIRDQIERHLDKLQQRLELIGLQVQTLGVRENLPDPDATLTPPRSQLIDIKT